jgi:hypothetical protein
MAMFRAVRVIFMVSYAPFGFWVTAEAAVNRSASAQNDEASASRPFFVFLIHCFDMFLRIPAGKMFFSEKFLPDRA